MAVTSTPPGPRASRQDAEQARQARRRRHAALAAMLFPLFFLVVIAIGLLAMHSRRMEFFKPAPSSNGALEPPTGQAPASSV
jgi:hypothetical protein